MLIAEINHIASRAGDGFSPHLERLITLTGHGIGSESDLVELTDFLMTYQEELKQDSLQLADDSKRSNNDRQTRTPSR